MAWFTIGDIPDRVVKTNYRLDFGNRCYMGLFQDNYWD